MAPEIREKYHLHVIPTPFIVNGVDHRDGVSMGTKEFYSLLDHDDVNEDFHVSY